MSNQHDAFKYFLKYSSSKFTILLLLTILLGTTNLIGIACLNQISLSNLNTTIPHQIFVINTTVTLCHERTSGFLFQTAYKHQYNGHLILALEEFRAIEKERSDVIWFREAEILDALGRYSEALVILRNNNAEKNISISADLSARDGDLEKGILLYTKAIEINPTYSPAWQGLGEIYWKQRNLLAAKSAYENALTLYPHDTDINYRLGTIELELRNYNQAIQHAKTVLETDTHDPLSYVLIGTAYRLQSQYTMAEEWYYKILEYTDETTLGHYYLGVNAVEHGQPEVALKHLQQVPVGDTSASQANWYYWVARAYFGNGSYEQAFDHQTKAIELIPENAVYHMLLGDIYSNTNQLENAVKEYQWALSLDPNNLIARTRINEFKTEE